VPSRQVQVDCGVLKLGMSEKYLDGAQIGPCFEHMRGETVPERVRRYVLLNTGLLGCVGDSIPDDLLRDGHICPPVLHCAWKQKGLWLHPAPILAQGLQQLRGQHDVTVSAALALADMNDHPFAVDVGDLQATQLGSSQPGCIQRHQHGAMHQVPSRINQPRYFFRTEYSRQLPRTLGKRNLIGQIRSPKGLHEEKSQSRRTTLDSPGR